MLGCMKNKLESRLPGKISITSDMQMIPPNSRRQRGTKDPPDEGERREWKSWLKTQHSKYEDHGIWSHHFMANIWGKNTVRDFIFLGSKITADGDGSNEIKRCLLLGRKVMTNLLLSRFSRVRLCATPETAAYQAPPSLGFKAKDMQKRDFICNRYFEEGNTISLIYYFLLSNFLSCLSI